MTWFHAHSHPRRTRLQPVLIVLAAIAIGLTLAPIANAAAAPPHSPSGSQSPTTTPGAQGTAAAQPTQKKSNGNCSALSMAAHVLDPFSNCQPLNQAAHAVYNTVTGLPSTIANGVMDQVTQWMVGAAQTVNGFVVKQEGVTTTPELTSSWYQDEFGQLAALGAGLALLVAMIGLASAVLRRDPEGLGEILYGIIRAGWATSVVVALTVIGLGVADGISNDVAHSMSHTFFDNLSAGWGAKNFGGLGSAALAFLIALVDVIAAVLVWFELLVRDAAIYVAVLFFPVAVAAAIWPALAHWVRRLLNILLMFVILKPVMLITLALGAGAAAGGLSFAGGGVGQSLGTILAGVVIYCLAAFTPWTLLHLMGTEVGTLGRGGSRGDGRPARSDSSRTSESSSSQQVGGALGSGQIDGGGIGTPALAAAAAGRSNAGNSNDSGSDGSGRGKRFLPTIGGSGQGARQSSAVSPALAAAAGWVGGAVGAVSTVADKGRHIADRGAASVHTASGAGGTLPPSSSRARTPGSSESSQPPVPPGNSTPPPPGDGPPGDGSSPGNQPPPDVGPSPGNQPPPDAGASPGAQPASTAPPASAETPPPGSLSSGSPSDGSPPMPTDPSRPRPDPNEDAKRAFGRDD